MVPLSRPEAFRGIKQWTLTARQGSRYPGAAMLTLLDDLDAFFLEHRRCGDLDGGVEGGRVWMTCECGAGLCHWLAPPLGGRQAPRAGERDATLPLSL